MLFIWNVLYWQIKGKVVKMSNECQSEKTSMIKLFLYSLVGVQLYPFWFGAEFCWAESNHYRENSSWNWPRAGPQWIEESPRSYCATANAFYGKWKQYYTHCREGDVSSCRCLDIRQTCHKLRSLCSWAANRYCQIKYICK